MTVAAVVAHYRPNSKQMRAVEPSNERSRSSSAGSSHSFLRSNGFTGHDSSASLLPGTAEPSAPSLPPTPVSNKSYLGNYGNGNGYFSTNEEGAPNPMPSAPPPEDITPGIG